MINYFCHYPYLYISWKHYFVKKFIFTWVWERYIFKTESSTFLLTHSMGRVLLEKLIGFHSVHKFPSFYGPRTFVTSFKSAHHLSPSWAISIQSMSPHPTSRRPILILSSLLDLGLPSCLFPSGFPTKTLYTRPLSTKSSTCPAHLILFVLITQAILGEHSSLSSSLCSFLHSQTVGMLNI